MSITPLITFKAGICDLDVSVEPHKAKPRTTPGYLYLYTGEDELIHFCWRPRSASLHSAELDLVMIPGDGQFQPYDGNPAPAPDQQAAPTNGRIYALKFSSSSQRYLFWMQSKSQSPHGDPSYFGPRDRRLGDLVDQLLQGEEVDVPRVVAEIRAGNNGPDEDEDEAMEDVEGTGEPGDHHSGSTGGAGPGATGGDVREEGEGPREGGADGGRADANSATQASQIVQNFLDSLKGGEPGAAAAARDDPFTTLPDLLPPKTTIQILDRADMSIVDNLLSYLPSSLILLAHNADGLSPMEAMSGSTHAALEALSLEQKKGILRKVFHSPQLSQSLASLTVALRDGGLPSVSEALGFKVKHNGFIKGGAMPLAGGEAVAAFIDGVKKTVEEEKAEEEEERDENEDDKDVPMSSE
ncbi:MAG: hypothetical protein M1838_002980 [Thelocarpon superellum]|nr:MAG: hypothetical protein M1838_002980 [Thelocarpon superellum]